jgi:hypothetical protein
VFVQQGTEHLGAGVIAARGVGVVIGQLVECGEMGVQPLEEWRAIELMRGQEFGKRQLHVVLTHQPTAQFHWRGMPSGTESLPQGFAA